MRCSVARERISRLTGTAEGVSDPSLASHLETCLDCALVLRSHGRLLAELDAPAALPDFGDLAPGVLARLDARAFDSRQVWRRAALAAMALAALALGYLLGLTTSETQPEGMAATYQQAFTELPSGSVDLSYLGPSGKDAPSVPARSAP